MENIKDLTAKIATLTETMTLLLTQNVVQFGTQNNKGGSTKRQIALNLKQLNKEETEFMQTQKNVRIRKDGRFEWQKMIAGIWHREIDRDYKELKHKIARHERELKQILKHTRFISRIKRDRPILFDLCVASVKANRQNADNLHGLLRKHLSKLTRPIDEYTKIDILNFLKDMPIQPKTACQVLKKVFAEATEEGIIERNTVATLKCPPYDSNKGRMFTLAEQRLIQAHKHDSGMADEIDFYLMVGCRANEAMNCVPNFDKSSVYVERSKVDGTSGHVRISKSYCNILREKWHTMFRAGSGQKYGVMFRDYLIKLGIKYDDTHLHSLRHTFCSNLFYLGCNDRTRQYYMGHKDSRMTQERYTTYDPTITRQDIIEIYGDLYPDYTSTPALLAS